MTRPKITAATEIPPRARRRGPARPYPVESHGNTSACAEKSQRQPRQANQGWKYLRVRGEENQTRRALMNASEIPPRARRRVFPRWAAVFPPGNTSACAEKRSWSRRRTGRRRKYLRVRGEERPLANSGQSQGEIPPRARRRVSHAAFLEGISGNTSACAEKSLPENGRPKASRKYLRVRGEEISRQAIETLTKEIPPRARRRDCNSPQCGSEFRNTSACAEKRFVYLAHGSPMRKYLRVRGEERRS